MRTRNTATSDNAPSHSDPWLSTLQAAAQMGLGRGSIYAAVAAGQLRALVVNRRRDLRIRQSWLDDWARAKAPRKPR
jgi:excisionase family DNA binding protein